MNIKRVWLVVILGVIFITGCGSSPDKSVVLITVTKDSPKDSIEIALGIKTETGHGSGFAVNGKIYTCMHVINGAKSIKITLRDGTIESAKVLRIDKDSDLAELSVKETPPSLKIRRNPPIFPESITQIGNPADFLFVTTSGHFLTFDGQHNIFLIDTFGGNSGSPLIDHNGFVVGMTHSILQGTRFTDGGSLSELLHFINPQDPM